MEVSVFRKKTQIGLFNKTNRFVFLERRFLSGLCFISKLKSAGLDFIWRENAAKIQEFANSTDLCF